MKITILGSGSAYGSPMCFNSWGKDQDINEPKNMRLRPSLLLCDQGKDILVDMGPDFRTQMNQNNIRNLDAVFITHGHYDHMIGLPELWRASTLLGKPITVYASQETMQEIKSVFAYMFETRNDDPNSRVIWCEFKHRELLNIQGLELQTFGVPHHHLHTSCFRYQNFAYVPDFQELPQEAKSHLLGLDLLVMECNNGFEKRNNGHSDLDDVLAYIAALKPKKAILTHLSARVDYAKLKQALPKSVDVAYDGMIIDF